MNYIYAYTKTTRVIALEEKAKYPNLCKCAFQKFYFSHHQSFRVRENYRTLREYGLKPSQCRRIITSLLKVNSLEGKF